MREGRAEKGGSVGQTRGSEWRSLASGGSLGGTAAEPSGSVLARNERRAHNPWPRFCDLLELQLRPQAWLGGHAPGMHTASRPTNSLARWVQRRAAPAPCFATITLGYHLPPSRLSLPHLTLPPVSPSLT
jgi:hypothetical protein